MKSNIFNLTSVLVLSSIFSLSAYAAPSMKPGLWEHSFKMTSTDGKIEKAMLEMKKQLAAMPAEQRKMMEDMMAKQGVGLGANGKGTSIKVCISKEQAAKLEFPNNENEKCTNTIVKQTADSVETKFLCDGNPKTEGTAAFTLVSSTSYDGKAVINVTKDGKTDRMNMDSKGSWLSSDCGKIKPYTSKK